MVTYAVVDTYLGISHIVSDSVANSSGLAITVSSEVDDSDGNAFLVFAAGITTTTPSANAFVATDDRTFIA